MKHLTNIFCGTCLLALAASPSYADNQQPANNWVNWYANFSGDVTWLHSDTGGGGNVALGTQLFNNNSGDFRLEGEIGYHDVSPIHYWTYMGNLYYDFNGFSSQSSDKIVPYVGAGIGDADIFGHGDDGNAFAYQFMAGVSYIPSTAPNMAWSLGYRYVGSSSVNGHDDLDLDTSDRLHANNLELATRFYF